MASDKEEMGCDMRGFLSFQILFLLSKRQMHGEQLAEELEKRRGGKPKPGTIYPALKELKERHLIIGHRAGKTVVYVLTAEGKRSEKYAMSYFCRCFGEMFDE